jgi:hypothetical protein
MRTGGLLKTHPRESRASGALRSTALYGDAAARGSSPAQRFDLLIFFTPAVGGAAKNCPGGRIFMNFLRAFQVLKTQGKMYAHRSYFLVNSYVPMGLSCEYPKALAGAFP